MDIGHRGEGSINQLFAMKLAQFKSGICEIIKFHFRPLFFLWLKITERPLLSRQEIEKFYVLKKKPGWDIYK